jgi:hypothetical protein
MSFGLMGPDGHPRMWISTRTRTRTCLDPGAGSGAPTGQFPDPHLHPTECQTHRDPPHGVQIAIPSLVYIGLSPHVEHNDKNHFKILLLYKMMWQMMLDGCWRGMTWLDDDVDTLYTKRIGLNDP